VLWIEWAEPRLPRPLSCLLLIELALNRDLQQGDHEKPNTFVEPPKANETPGNGDDQPAERRL
jgi:hypothetical protein